MHSVLNVHWFSFTHSSLQCLIRLDGENLLTAVFKSWPSQNRCVYMEMKLRTGGLYLIMMWLLKTIGYGVPWTVRCWTTMWCQNNDSGVIKQWYSDPFCWWGLCNLYQCVPCPFRKTQIFWNFTCSKHFNCFFLTSVCFTMDIVSMWD